MTARLDRAIEHYATKLTTLEEATPNPSKEQILDVLTARDAVHTTLTDKTRDSPEDLMTVIQLDKRLKEQAGRVTQAVNKLADWRASLNPPTEAWWWSLDKEQEASETKADVLWALIAVVFLTLSLSLILDISRRFLAPGPDFWGLLATVSQAAFGLLIAGGALTQIGQKTIERIFDAFSIKRHLRQEWKTGLSFVLLVALAVVWLSLPLVARLYNDTGVRYWHDGQLTSAADAYRRAISLNPRCALAHFNLAVVYEEQQRYDDAIKSYQLTLENQAELDTTYNNLARLYIAKEEDYGAAVELLLHGRSLAQDDETRYAIAKNLGWAYLMLDRYRDAEKELRHAITLEPDGAAAHCLLAQTLEEMQEEAEGDSEVILNEWRDCLAFGPDETKFEENTWAATARQKLEAEQ